MKELAGAFFVLGGGVDGDDKGWKGGEGGPRDCWGLVKEVGGREGEERGEGRGWRATNEACWWWTGVMRLLSAR